MKKRIKRFSILLLVSLVIFLIYSNRRISGTWIGIHYYDNHSNSNWKQPDESILNFSAFKVNLYEPFASDDITKTPYLIIGKSILTNSKNDFDIFKTSIKHLNKDTLVFSSYNSTHVYRKVHDSLKQKNITSFTEKLIVLKSKKYIDTVYFTDKYLLLMNKKGEKLKWIDLKYQLKAIDDFQFLATDNGIMLLVKKTKEQVCFYQFSKDSVNIISVKEIHPNKKLQKLIVSVKKSLKHRDSIFDVSNKNPHPR